MPIEKEAYALRQGFARLILLHLFHADTRDKLTKIEGLTADWEGFVSTLKGHQGSKIGGKLERLILEGLTLNDGLAVAEDDFNETVLLEEAGVSAETAVRISDEIRQFKHQKTQLAKALPFTIDREIIGNSRSWLEILMLANKYAAATLPVLISGETGVGKDVAAEFIHRRSPRRGESFQTLNCGALPDNLMESELFGYAEGAFTGAQRGGKVGRLEAADGGTLLLDEIDALTPRAQAALLRFIEAGEIQKPGASKNTVADVRIIAASNQDLTQLVKRGDFRIDLYYRLNILSLHIPPLRERKEDIPLFVHHFLTKICREQVIPGKFEVSESAMQKLIAGIWEGNLRELYGVLSRAVFKCVDKYIEADDIDILQEEQATAAEDEVIASNFKPETIRRIEDLNLSGSEKNKLLRFFSRNHFNSFANSDYADYFKISSSTARNRLRKLAEAGILFKTGDKKGARYKLKEG